ncbi:hypothetical protein CDAR_256841 [Caerostris darwini]|uniref:Uncharacterized protein n=1 Tax=Caerostris darwini TaxID=1538125 RepID=A0AAV4PWH0_9ARAC|nr:hypothetical protein CDAR_256841 [Caerostris darwini]
MKWRGWGVGGRVDSFQKLKEIPAANSLSSCAEIRIGRTEGVQKISAALSELFILGDFQDTRETVISAVSPHPLFRARARLATPLAGACDTWGAKINTLADFLEMSPDMDGRSISSVGVWREILAYLIATGGEG